MDRLDADAFDERWSIEIEIPPDEGGHVPPPDPPEGGDRRPRRQPPDGRRHLLSNVALLVGAIVLVLLSALQMTVISLGARGGQLAAYAASAAFAALFLGPFLLGSLWFDRMRRASPGAS